MAPLGNELTKSTPDGKWNFMKRRKFGMAISAHERDCKKFTYQDKAIVKGDLERLSSNLTNTLMNFIGSSENGLGTETSDIDVILHLSNDNVMMSFNKILQTAGNLEGGFKLKTYVRKARVPVIRLVHCRTNIEVDITFDSPSARRQAALQNTKLIRIYVTNNPIIRKLYLFIKLIFDYKPLFTTKLGGLSSYTHSLVIIYFFINKMGIPLLDVTTLKELNSGAKSFSPAEVVMKYLHFIMDEFAYLTLDVRQVDSNVKCDCENYQIEDDCFDDQYLIIKDPFENRDLAKNFTKKNLEIFRNLAEEWIDHFNNHTKGILIQQIKHDVPEIVKKAVEAYNPCRGYY